MEALYSSTSCTLPLVAYQLELGKSPDLPVVSCRIWNLCLCQWLQPNHGPPGQQGIHWMPWRPPAEQTPSLSVRWRLHRPGHFSDESTRAWKSWEPALSPSPSLFIVSIVSYRFSTLWKRLQMEISTWYVLISDSEERESLSPPFRPVCPVLLYGTAYSGYLLASSYSWLYAQWGFLVDSESS